MKAIILCATQRCGSTMVCEDMRNTTVLGKPEEFFINWLNSEVLGKDWNTELEKIIKQGSTKNNIFSIKIMSDYMQNVSLKLNTTLDEPLDNILEVLPKIFSNTIWVRIFRKNTIKQAISRIMARQTDICHTVNEDANNFFAGKTAIVDHGYNKHTKYNYQEIITEVKKIREEEIAWNSFFEHNNIKPIRIVYEDAVDNPTVYIPKIAESIGIDKSELMFRERKIQKLGNSINADWYKKTLELYAKDLFVHGSIH